MAQASAWSSGVVANLTYIAYLKGPGQGPNWNRCLPLCRLPNDLPVVPCCMCPLDRSQVIVRSVCRCFPTCNGQARKRAPRPFASETSPIFLYLGLLLLLTGPA